MKKEIGIFVTEAKYRLNIPNTISGHVQVAIYTANILERAGYSVTIITTKSPSDYDLPPFTSKKLLVDSNVVNIFYKWPKQGINWRRLPLFILELFKISTKYELIHFFGENRAAILMGLIKTIRGSKLKVLLTFHNFKTPNSVLSAFFFRKILNRIDYLITLTEFTKLQLIKTGVDETRILIMRPGIRSLIPNLEKTLVSNLIPYILFWRNADWENGVDLCIDAFLRLYSSYQNINFVFAIRPGCFYDSQILKMSDSQGNIHLFFFPYPNGINIETLLSSASIVVLPFRKLTINPQFAVLETLASGSALIVSDIESNSEIVQNRMNGIIISPKRDELINAIEELLNNPSLRSKISNNGRLSILKKWNWDDYEQKILHLYKNILGKAKEK